MLSFSNGSLKRAGEIDELTTSEVTATTAATPVATLSAMDDAPAADTDPTAIAASPLPLPPDHTPGRWAERVAAHRRRHRRPGDLAPGWASGLVGGWLLVTVGLGAVWVSSRTTGMSTWWLGPEARPVSPLVNALPFVLPLAVVTGALLGARHMAWLGVLAAMATAAVGIGDLGRVAGYAVAELALAVGGLLVSLASRAGTYRTAPTAAADTPER